MQGMNKVDGTLLTGHAHLRQSITDILTTPKGSRVMRRNYGSRLFQLVDAPLNQETLIELYAATAEALELWEPRFIVHHVKVTEIIKGKTTIDLTGEYLPKRQQITLEGLVI